MMAAATLARAPFDRPLVFGDREQVRAINAMNTDGLYCPACWAIYQDGQIVADGLFRETLGRGSRCPSCRRMHLLRGARHPRRAREASDG